MKISELELPVTHNSKGEVVGFEKDGDIYARCESCLCYHIEEDMVSIDRQLYCTECVDEMAECGICHSKLLDTMAMIYISKHDFHICGLCIDEYQEMVWELKNREMGEI